MPQDEQPHRLSHFLCGVADISATTEHLLFRIKTCKIIDLAWLHRLGREGSRSIPPPNNRIALQPIHAFFPDVLISPNNYNKASAPFQDICHRFILSQKRLNAGRSKQQTDSLYPQQVLIKGNPPRWAVSNVTNCLPLFLCNRK